MKQEAINPARRALRTFLAFVVLFLIYAIAVEATDINVQTLQSPARQEQVVGVLRFLADPNLTDPDAADLTLGEESGPVTLTETTRNTLDLIVETIFMALMATSIGTLLAVPVSFLAARNLMLEITSPLAAIMLGLVALPIGGAAGGLAASALINGAQRFEAQPLAALGLLIVSTLVLFVLTRVGPPLVSTTARPPGQAVLALGRALLLMALALFALGLLAVLGAVAGVWLQANLGWFGFLGNFLQVLADLVQLMLAPLLALLAAMVTASFGSRYGQEAVLRLSGAPARGVAAVFTAGGVAVLLYGIGASLNWLYQFDNPTAWIVWSPVVGGGIAGLASLLLQPKRPFAVGAVIYTLSRSVLNALRSIEPLIMAVVFVVWVGLGPLPV